jgi:hypothetical protein
MLEKQIEMKWRKKIEAEGGLLLKWTSPGYTGVPDRIKITPGGVISFIEFKAPGKKPTPRQLRVHEILRSLGCTVEVIDHAP